MESCQHFSTFLKRLVGFAVGGVLVLLLLKPLLIMLMAVAAWTVIGFLFWLPLHAAIFGRQGVWLDCWDRYWRRVERLKPAINEVKGRCEATANRIGTAVHDSLLLARDALAEVAAGSVVGAVLALAMDVPEMETAIGALLGGAVGGCVALGRRS
jgi:hypothetical protein